MQFTAPSQIIQIVIAETISSKFEIPLKSQINSQEISINVCYPKYDAHYTSPIALAISNRLGLNALQIAEAIAQSCSQNPDISPQWQIKAFGKGWLNICLSEKYIAESLLALDLWQPNICYGAKIDYSQKVGTQSPESNCQYAYARCWALIRLAHAHSDILGHNSKISDALEPVEVSLLLQQIAIAEYIQAANSILELGKLSRSLAEAFLNFYDRCRIFGVSQDLAYRRFLQIKTTQKLLLAIAPPEINYAKYL